VQSAVDAEAVYGLTTLTTLSFRAKIYEAGTFVKQAGEWVLDLSRLTTLTTLRLWRCSAVKDKQVLELSHLTGLTGLDLGSCRGVTSEGLRALSSLTGLSTIALFGCPKLTAAAKQALRTAIPNLTIEN